MRLRGQKVLHPAAMQHVRSAHRKVSCAKFMRSVPAIKLMTCKVVHPVHEIGWNASVTGTRNACVEVFALLYCAARSVPQSIAAQHHLQ